MKNWLAGVIVFGGCGVFCGVLVYLCLGTPY